MNHGSQRNHLWTETAARHSNPRATDVHRKPHQPIRLPAVSRHIAYRRDDSDISDSKWIERIERWALNLRSILLNQPERCGIPTVITNLSDQYPALEPIKPTHKQVAEAPRPAAIELLRNKYSFDAAGKHHITEGIFNDGSRYEIIVIRSEWQCMPILLRIEVFEEYFTLTSTIEFMYSGVSRLNPSHVSALDGIVSFLNGDDSDHAAFKQQCNSLRNDIWSKFDVALENARRQAQVETSVGSESDDQTWLLEAFADFRGFLLETLPDHKKGERRKICRLEDIPQDELLSSRLNPRSNFTNDEGRLAFTEAIFPLLLTIDNERYGSPIDNNSRSMESSEYTWSTFENNGALYGSNLGNTRIQGGLADELTYVLLFDHDDDRTVGRVMGRLHTMGTLRVATIFDFSRTLIRDQIIANLDAELSHINSVRDESALRESIARTEKSLVTLCTSIHSLASQFSDGSTYTDLHPDKIERTMKGYIEKLPSLDIPTQRYIGRKAPKFSAALNTIRKELAALSRQVNAILESCTAKLGSNSSPNPLSSGERNFWRRLKRECKRAQFELAKIQHARSVEEFRSHTVDSVIHALEGINDHMRVGLEYRSLRTNYYEMLFETLAKAMDVRAVPGFQKYDEYVGHKLYRAHSLIAFAEKKHANVLQLARAMKAKFELDRKSLHDKKMHRFQAFGEVALVFIISPYYMMSVAEKIFKHQGLETLWYFGGWIFCIALVMLGRKIYETLTDRDD